MKITDTALTGVKLIEPKVFADDRGWFMENWRHEHYVELGIDVRFVQTNSSHSSQGVIRGLHYQHPQSQGKLVWVSAGEVFDVAVDIRPDSPQFGQWVGAHLTHSTHHQLWIPPGFAHGFQVLSQTATFHYQCTKPYRAEFDRAIAYNDPDIGVAWPKPPQGISSKDAIAPALSDISHDQLPTCASF